MIWKTKSRRKYKIPSIKQLIFKKKNLNNNIITFLQEDLNVTF